jgi:hypothetical protein
MPERSREELKVVAHLTDGSLLKGFMRSNDPAFDPLAAGALGTALPNSISIELPSGEARAIQLDAVKALFFVKTFEGRTDYTELKFFDRNPQIEGLWVKIRFRDGETTEGIVHNSLPFVKDSGFFLRPPDPESNNRVLYVIKNSLADFRILGIRSEY